jgi:hypothetical protein
VSTDQITPILRLVDTRRLRLRLEIDEADVGRVLSGMAGQFTVRGNPETAGHFTVASLIPQFGPKRLFNPDTSARLDTRTLPALGDLGACEFDLFPGQRITATISIAPPNDSPGATPTDAALTARSHAERRSE